MRIILLLPLLFFSMPIYAADILPHQQATEPTTQASHLSKDLIPDDNVDVRSYAHENGDMITEYSVSGRVYAVRVQPVAGLPAYYLYDRDGDGTFEQRLPGGYKLVSPPMWVIKKF